MMTTTTTTITFGRSSVRVEAAGQDRIRLEVCDPTGEPTILDFSRDEYARLLDFLREAGRFSDELK